MIDANAAVSYLRPRTAVAVIGVAAVVTSSVYPSGGALATTSVPIVPPAPGRFSTRKGWPSACVSRSATVRPIRSDADPVAKGTITRTGLLG